MASVLYVLKLKGLALLPLLGTMCRARELYVLTPFSVLSSITRTIHCVYGDL
jgi:hypothetical protein